VEELLRAPELLLMPVDMSKVILWHLRRVVEEASLREIST
jgi:hypothetical protein